MPVKLTDAELRELLELEAAATSAPWRAQGCGGIQMDGSRDGYMIENEVQRRIASLYPTSTSREIRELDAKLIESARNLARPLAEAVLRLRALLHWSLTVGTDEQDEWERHVMEALRDAD